MTVEIRCRSFWCETSPRHWFAAFKFPDIEGRTYNLVDQPLMNARDYLEELQRLSGTKISVHFRPIWQSYLSDFGKWVVKLAVRHPDRHRIPSYRDWESAHTTSHI